MSALQDEVKSFQQMRKIRQSNLSDDKKIKLIQEIRLSNLDDKLTSIEIIISTVNPMLGSTTLLVPVIFNKVGMYNSIAVLIILCILNFLTGRLILKTAKQSESELSETIERLLGKKYIVLYNLISSLLMYLVAIVYFLLMCNMAHGCLNFFFDLANTQIANKNEITFSIYSYQYTVLIAAAINFYLINLKNLDTIMKLGRYGFLTIIMYLIFLMVKFFVNLSDNNFSVKQIEQKNQCDLNLYTNQIGQATGCFALSFLIQNCVQTIYRKNINTKNNTRDLGISYIGSLMIYIYIGVFGQIGILGKNTVDPNTVMDFFASNDVLVFFLMLFYAIYLSLILPFLMMISRDQFLCLFYGQTKAIPPKYEFIFNLSMILFSILCGIINYKPVILLSLNGALAGFFVSYFYPIALHWANITQNDNQTNQLLSNMSDQEQSNDSINSNLHKKKYSKQYIYSQFVIYGLFQIFGLSLLVILLKDLF